MAQASRRDQGRDDQCCVFVLGWKRSSPGCGCALQELGLHSAAPDCSVVQEGRYYRSVLGKGENTLPRNQRCQRGQPHVYRECFARSSTSSAYFIAKLHRKRISSYRTYASFSHLSVFPLTLNSITPSTSKLAHLNILSSADSSRSFIVSKARGKSGPLFNFDVHEDVRLIHDARIEKDESHAGKVCERIWYTHNMHIFPASR